MCSIKYSYKNCFCSSLRVFLFYNVLNFLHQNFLHYISSNNECSLSKSANLIPPQPFSHDDGMHCADLQRERTETHLIRWHTKTRNEKARNERANTAGKRSFVNTRSQKSAGNNLSGSSMAVRGTRDLLRESSQCGLKGL